MSANGDACMALPDHWMARTPHHFEVWAKILKLLFDVSPQLEKSARMLCKYAILQESPKKKIAWHRVAKNCFVIRVASNAWCEKTHTTHTFCCPEFESPSAVLAPQSIVQLLKHEHYDTEHCGTRPYVSDKHLLKTISNEHLPHFIASWLLLSIQRENAEMSGALLHTFAYQCKSGFKKIVIFGK